ncbi:MAG: hypothetical protein U0235_17995 [Polyangiaceae bacterium]
MGAPPKRTKIPFTSPSLRARSIARSASSNVCLRDARPSMFSGGASGSPAEKSNVASAGPVRGCARAAAPVRARP